MSRAVDFLRPLSRLLLLSACLVLIVLLSGTNSRAGIAVSAEATNVERSDAFWTPLTRHGHYGHNYDSVEAISGSVHVVVRGRVTDVRESTFRYFERMESGDDDPDLDPIVPILVALVEVDEVLKGEPVMRMPDIIEVALEMPWTGWQGFLLPNIPLGDHVFFLMNDAQWRKELAFPADDRESTFLYWRPNGDQAVLREIDGRVDVISPKFGRYPWDLDGASFADVVADVRAFGGR